MLDLRQCQNILSILILFCGSLLIGHPALADHSCEDLFFLQADSLQSQKVLKYRNGFKLIDPPKIQNAPPMDEIEAAREKLNFNGIEVQENKNSFTIVPNSKSTNLFMRIVNIAFERGYRIEIVFRNSKILGPRTLGMASSSQKKIYLRFSILDHLDDPKNIGTIQHELRHIIESTRGSDASKMYINVIEPTFGDGLLRGYGSGDVSLRLDEPFAYFQGSEIQNLLSSGTSTQELLDN